MTPEKQEISELLGFAGRSWVGVAIRLSGGWLVEDLSDRGAREPCVVAAQREAEAALRELGAKRILRCVRPPKSAKPARKRRPR